MSQTVTDHRSPAPPPRPATVTVAAALQFALVGTLLLAVATATAEAIRYDALIDRAARTVAARVSAGDVAFERSMNLSGTLVFAVSALVLAVWLGVTAVWLRRGSNVARILSLVGLGAPLVLGLLACVFGGVMGVLAVGMLVASPPEGFDDEGPFAEDDFDDEGPVPGEDFAGEALSDELARLDTGGWSIAFEVTGMTTTVLALLLGIATGILLLTGASRRYFRPRQAAPAFPHPYPPPAPWPPPAYPAPYWYGGPPPPVYPPPPAYPPPPVYPPPVYPPPVYPPPRAHPPAPPPD